MQAYETLQSIWGKTLSYSNIFDYPLTPEEIYTFAITQTAIPKNIFEDWYKKNYSTLQNEYDTDGKLWSLKKRSPIFGLRQKRNEISQEKFATAKKIVTPLRFIPWIKLIAVTGTVAAQNATQQDDVDLFVLVSPNRAWTTRLLVLSYLSLIGRRYNTHTASTHTTFCLNHIQDIRHMETHDQDIYIANEIVRTRILYQKENAFGAFLAANAWISNYLANATIINRDNANKTRLQKHLISERISYYVLTSLYVISAPIRMLFIPFVKSLDRVENFSMRIQHRYSKNLQIQKLDNTLLQKHLRDNRLWILREYAQLIDKKS